MRVRSTVRASSPKPDGAGVQGIPRLRRRVGRCRTLGYLDVVAGLITGHKLRASDLNSYTVSIKTS